jgi:hypothetical protein
MAKKNLNELTFFEKARLIKIIDAGSSQRAAANSGC